MHSWATVCSEEKKKIWGGASTPHITDHSEETILTDGLVVEPREKASGGDPST